MTCFCCNGWRSGEPIPEDCMRAEIERLREKVTGKSGYEFVSSMAEMSDGMTRMAHEIERLKAERDHWKKEAHDRLYLYADDGGKL